jgi:hypothetical protein
LEDGDGPNLYGYVHNNPLYYTDPDGRLTFLAPLVVPLFTLTWGAAETAFVWVTAEAVGYAVAGAAAGWALSKGIQKLDRDSNSENHQEPRGGKPKRSNNANGGPPRDPLTSDYLPDPAAAGYPHTTLGIRQGSRGPYGQGATFENGKFQGRTDLTDHGRGDHPNPHFHPATGPNSAGSPAQPIFFS